ncbi:ABC transporter C family member 3 [Morella rubra]|uniref:ABC-type xenobiotic transporter n=1 Tax=Morella rubra TaxID=262757 RepID=A0A6A1UEH1_9ROSI|nr:ABC transporter C family member 3 [Morella rubra]
MGPLIALGNKKTLDLEDVPQLAPGDSVVGAFPTFRNMLEAECGTLNRVTTLKLVKALFSSAWKEILLTAFFVIMYTLASYVGPFLIDTFVQYLNGRREFKNEGYVLVSVFFAAKLVECLSKRHRFFRVQQIGIRVRSVLITMIYNKALTLSCQSNQGHTSGEIINFMTVDAERVGDFGWYLHDPWMVLMQVVIALIILYKNLGLASIATLVATVLVMLANVPLGKLQEKFQDKIMESKDRRMKATSEILRNVRILKLQGWEMKFLSKIIELRKTEEGWLKKFVYTSAMTSFVFWGAPTFVSVVTFGAYVIEKLPRGSSDTAIEIIDGNFSWDLSSPNPSLKVQHGMRVAVCGTVGSGKSSLLSCILGEVPKISGTIKLCGTKAYVAQSPWIQSGKIEENILFDSWDLSSPNPSLKGINLKVQHGMNVESGKSSLLSCILGEVPKISGTIKLCGTKAYVAQSPWIQSGKIEENILFGKEMEKEKYERVLEACSLKKDLEILSLGIRHAVDAHTGSHLFKECLLGLLSLKTVIYVTHQVEFLPAADLILVMKDGRITQAGKYSDILNSGTDFMELVGAHQKALSALDFAEAGVVSDGMGKEVGSTITTNGVVQKHENKDVQDGKADDSWVKGPDYPRRRERERGALVPFILLAQVLFQLLQIGSNYWMAWATPVSQDVKPAVGISTLIMVYVALAIGSSFCILVRATLLVTAGYKTATLLFTKMHFCIFRAPMSFFDATPSGRILNRVSTDQSVVDLNMAFQVGSFAFSMIQLLGIIAVMSQVAWQVFIIFFPVIGACIWYQQYYLPSARELARLVGVCKAPVIQHFAETISGSTTIRSFDEDSRFSGANMKLTDAYCRPKFNIAGAMEWLCFRLDVLSSITFVFSLFFLISIPEGLIDPVRNLCQMENKIISVERLIQYTCIPSEPPLVIEENQPDSSWPSHGEVDIRVLQVRYAPHMPIVLRGLTCTFRGGMKTGIVGRTGSGKSTLIQALFRIVEPTLALDKCQLGDEVRKKEGKLDSTVTENGENWSVGQRQLVCLGRVLLKKSKVLVLDEATASVDTATDNLIQETLRQHFYDCTVITIAHRITSVLDSGMVLLLNSGLIEEYDSPTRLLENKSSSFSQLVAEYTMRSNSNF